MSDDGSYLALLDWRRQVHALYGTVRRLCAKDPAIAHEVWQRERGRLMGEHPQSPIAPGDGRAIPLRYFPYDRRLRFSAPLAPEWGERLEVRTSTGEALWLRRIGRVEIPLGRLPVFWVDVYGGGIFIPFRDATSGDATYGGGRYLIDTVKGADLGSNERNELVVDLNFAYHPSCHYDFKWSCPLAGPESRLDAKVEAGEMSWPGAAH